MAVELNILISIKQLRMQVTETVQISSVSTSLKKDIHVCDGDHCREQILHDSGG